MAECKIAGEAVLNLLQKDIKPRDIMTRKAFENAVTLIMVSASTSYLHGYTPSRGNINYVCMYVCMYVC